MATGHYAEAAADAAKMLVARAAKRSIILTDAGKISSIVSANYSK